MKDKKESSFGEEIFALAKKHKIPLNNVQDIQNALKGGMKNLFQGALEAEFDEYMGYEKYEQKKTNNYRNGTTAKTVKSNFGEIDIETPRDRNGNFDPMIIAKRQRDISDLETKIINMYGLGYSTRNIVETIKDIYGFDLDPSFISKITDKILPQIEAWKNRLLSKCYSFVFIDGIRFKVREEGMGKEISCYIIMGTNLDGQKELIGYWIGESESAKKWLSIFNEIKSRGVKRILVIISDNLPGISEAIKAAFPKTIIQKCIVHQIRNSLKFVSYKDRKEFVADMKKIYQAPSIKEARNALDKLSEKWNSKYAYAIKSWYKNFDELTSYFEFAFEIRKMIYTTNIIENINYQIRKVTKTKGSFTNVKALDKMIFLKLSKIENKWTKPIKNWGIIFNQLDIMFDLESLNLD